ncbi:hypothetical protein BGZ83_002877 [Gryganskiella cystojenkinii]|nr:hypothetical protein BGZ83_002877 [Gryganskiella cystojenkinii]
MEPERQNPDDIAYMNLLTREIPGVGGKPLTPAHRNGSAKEKISTKLASSSSTMTENQRSAIKTLETALEDALFVSEGEEPFETVHLIPKKHSSAATATPVAHTPLPTEKEFLTMVKEMRLITDDSEDEADDTEDLTCARTCDLNSVLSSSNPGADKIARALRDIFHYHASKHTSKDQSAKESDKVLALYRVSVASSTKVHIWVLGWVDQHLIGFHTISIES